MRTRYLISVILLITFLFSSFTLTGPEPVIGNEVLTRSDTFNNSSWSNPFGNPSLNSTLPDYNYTGYPSVEWSLRLPENSEGSTQSPVIGPEGNIYFNKGTDLISSSPEGVINWIRTLEDANEHVSNPTIGPGGTVLITTDQNTLVSFWENGTERFSIQIPDSDEEYKFPVSDGNSIFLVREQRLLKISEQGQILWNLSIPENDPLSPAIYNDSIYVRCEESILCYDTVGSLKWTTDLDSSILNYPVIDDLGRCWTITIGSGKYVIKIIDNMGDIVLDRPNTIGVGTIGTPTMTPDGRFAFIPDRETICMVNESGIITKESISTSGYGSFLLLPNGNKIITGSDGLSFFSPVESKIHADSRFRFAFTGDAVYYCTDSLHKIVFKDHKEPSFSNGPIKDQMISEGGMVSLILGSLFDMEDQTILNWTFELETDMENYSAEPYLFNDKYYMDIIPEEGINGLYQARIKATAKWRASPHIEFSEYSTYSNWFNINITSINSPPQILNEVLPGAYQSQTYSVKIIATDVDSKVDLLTFRVTGADWLYMKGCYLEGIAPRGSTDTYRINIYVEDLEGNSTRKKFEVDVLEAPEAPIIGRNSINLNEDEVVTVSISDRSSYYDEWIIIEDPDGVNDHVYKVEPGPHITIEMDQFGEKFDIIPELDFNGETWLDLTVTDSAGTDSRRIEVNIRSRTDPVRNVKIVPITDVSDIRQGELVSMKVEYTDPDDDYTGTIRVEWETNHTSYGYGGKDIGYDEILETYELDEGYHNITVSVRKNSGYSVQAYIDIYVGEADEDTEPQVEDGVILQERIDDQKDYDDTLAKWITIHFIIFMTFVLGPILCWIVHKLVVRSKEKKNKDKEVVS